MLKLDIKTDSQTKIYELLILFFSPPSPATSFIQANHRNESALFKFNESELPNYYGLYFKKIR